MHSSGREVPDMVNKKYPKYLATYWSVQVRFVDFQRPRVSALSTFINPFFEGKLQ
jgi:hypothetical protein